MSGVQTPTEPILHHTPHFVLRSLEARDASRDWGAWLNDADTANLLNSKPREITYDERLKYIARAAEQKLYLWGIFEKASDEMIGLWSIYVDPKAREYLLNVLIGPNSARNQGALTETRDFIYQYFFETLDLMAARCTVVGHNEYMIRRQKRRGWVHEHTSQKASAQGDKSIDILHYRLPREVWRKLDAP